VTRRRLAVIVAAALLAVFVAVKLQPSKDAGIPQGYSDAPFGAFVGYSWIGDVRAVGGSFTVPPIASGSRSGLAGTWIGVQGQGPPSRFVQIGVIESRFPSRRLHRLVNGYVTFWSDTARRYAAQAMFLVRAGDTISASLTLSNGVWSLAIVDRTRYRSAHVSVADEGRASFNQADWTQEDPGTSNNHEQYPQVAAPVFEHITVNATPLTASDPSLYSQWMSVNHHNLAPTALHDASFTLQRAPVLSTAAEQYERLSSPAAIAFEKFEDERTHWTPKTPYRTILDASSTLVQATRARALAVLAAKWPVPIRELLRSSNHATTTFLEDIRPPAILTPATFARWNSILTEASERAARAGRQLRATLGLPTGGSAGNSERP